METRQVWDLFGLHPLNRASRLCLPPPHTHITRLLYSHSHSLKLPFVCLSIPANCTTLKLCWAAQWAHYEVWTPWPELSDIWKELCEYLEANACRGQWSCWDRRARAIAIALCTPKPRWPRPDKAGFPWTEVLKRKPRNLSEEKQDRKWWSQTKGQEEKAEKQKCSSPCREKGAAAGPRNQSPCAI